MYNESGDVNITVYDQNMLVISTSDEAAPRYLNITNNLINGAYFNFDFANYTTNETYKLKFLNGTNAVGLFSMSGTLVDNEESFSLARYWMANATISGSSGNTRINISIPFSIP